MSKLNNESSDLSISDKIEALRVDVTKKAETAAIQLGAAAFTGLITVVSGPNLASAEITTQPYGTMMMLAQAAISGSMFGSGAKNVIQSRQDSNRADSLESVMLNERKPS